MKSARTSRRKPCDPLIAGTCETTHFTRLSVAATTSTWAAVARPPHPNARRIGLIQALREGNGVGIVPDLEPGIDLLAWFAVTRTEVAIVVHD